MTVETRVNDTNVRVARAILSGLCASLVGIGLARFAYTPLVPALIAARWFGPSQAAYLGAANFAGYLAGAVFGRRLLVLAPAAVVLRAMMTLAAATFFACAYPLPFLWFLAWRIASGLAGGVLMVLAALTVLPHVPPSRRGLAGGAVFTGVSLGIVISGVVVPHLLKAGLGITWNALGALALLLTLLAWAGWPSGQVSGQAANNAHPPASVLSRQPGHPALKWLYVQYGLNAFGLVPHMVFLVDFIARGLGRGLEVGAWYWVLFGLGAMAGPLLAGYAADRIGFVRASRFAMVMQVLAVGLPTVSVAPGWLAVSSAVAGAFIMGIVNLVLGRIRELVPADDETQRTAWSLATSGFALGQAGGAYGLSFVFARTGAYTPLFAIGTAVSALALAMDFAITRAKGGVGRNFETNDA